MLEQGGADIEIDDRIAADHQRGFIKKSAEVLNGLHATRRSFGFGQDVAVVIYPFEGVTDIYAPAATIAEILLDFLVVVRHVNHDLGDAMTRQMLDQVFHHRLAQNGHHRFWQVFRQRANPSALASGQYHCFCHF